MDNGSLDVFIEHCVNVDRVYIVSSREENTAGMLIIIGH